MASAESLDAAKEALDAGTPAEAESILADVSREEERDELFYLLAETARQHGHYSETGNQLNRIDDPVWASMGYFNLAMSHLMEESFSRARIALRVTRSCPARLRIQRPPKWVIVPAWSREFWRCVEENPPRLRRPLPPSALTV